MTCLWKAFFIIPACFCKAKAFYTLFCLQFCPIEIANHWHFQRIDFYLTNYILQNFFTHEFQTFPNVYRPDDCMSFVLLTFNCHEIQES